MDSTNLISQIQDALKRIDGLRKERQAIGSPKVKAWKTEVEQLLRLGGKNTSKLLQNFQAMRFGAGALGGEETSDAGVRFQAFQAELDSAEKLLKNAVQTIQIFGITEEQKLPDWFKQELKASGNIRVGGKDVDIKTVTVGELLGAVLAMAESDKSLDESLKREVESHVNAVKKHPLLSPFLNRTLDKLFPHLG